MTKKVKFYGSIFGIISIIGIIIIGGFKLERAIHYKLGYKLMVQETIREMVKQDALK